MPPLDRAVRLADALDLEFYIGPPRPAPGPGALNLDARDSDGGSLPATSVRDLESSAQTLNRVVTAAGGDPYPPDARPVERHEWAEDVRVLEGRAVVEVRGERIELAAGESRTIPAGAAHRHLYPEPARVVLGPEGAGVATGLADPSALAVGAVNEDGMPPGARPVDVHGLRAAAGGGALVEGEEVRSQAWFRRDWLDRHGLDPTRCLIVDVAGGSMEPVLPDGCSVLVDRNRRRRYVGRIYLARTDEGLVVKRAGKDGGGGWLLTSESDAPEHAPIPWPADAETIGEVRWMAASFP